MRVQRLLIYLLPPHMHSSPFPIINIPARVVHLLQLVNLHWHIITQSPWYILELTFGVIYSVDLKKCITAFLQHDFIIQNNFTDHLIHSSHLIKAATDFFTVSLLSPFLECHIVEIIYYIAFSDCLISLVIYI